MEERRRGKGEDVEAPQAYGNTVSPTGTDIYSNMYGTK